MKRHKIMSPMLTFARTGGGVNPPPLRFFADSEKRLRFLRYLMGQTLRNFW